MTRKNVRQEEQDFQLEKAKWCPIKNMMMEDLDYKCDEEAVIVMTQPRSGCQGSHRMGDKDMSQHCHKFEGIYFPRVFNERNVWIRG